MLTLFYFKFTPKPKQPIMLVVEHFVCAMQINDGRVGCISGVRVLQAWLLSSVGSLYKGQHFELSLVAILYQNLQRKRGASIALFGSACGTQSNPIPVLVPLPYPVTKVTTGQSHACAIVHSGALPPPQPLGVVRTHRAVQLRIPFVVFR